jgi:hypothetical protein
MGVDGAVAVVVVELVVAFWEASAFPPKPNPEAVGGVFPSAPKEEDGAAFVVVAAPENEKPPPTGAADACVPPKLNPAPTAAVDFLESSDAAGVVVPPEVEAAAPKLKPPPPPVVVVVEVVASFVLLSTSLVSVAPVPPNEKEVAGAGGAVEVVVVKGAPNPNDAVEGAPAAAVAGVGLVNKNPAPVLLVLLGALADVVPPKPIVVVAVDDGGAAVVAPEEVVCVDPRNPKEGVAVVVRLAVGSAMEDVPKVEDPKDGAAAVVAAFSPKLNVVEAVAGTGAAAPVLLLFPKEKPPVPPLVPPLKLLLPKVNVDIFAFEYTEWFKNR